MQSSMVGLQGYSSCRGEEDQCHQCLIGLQKRIHSGEHHCHGAPSGSEVDPRGGRGRYSDGLHIGRDN